MDRFFNRRAELIVGNNIYNSNQIDIDFSVPFTQSDDPDVAEITLYNLTQDSINRYKKNSRVILNAGYDGDLGTLVVGEIADYEMAQDGTDLAFTLYVAGGISRWASARVNKTFRAGTTNIQAMRELAYDFGLRIGSIQAERTITYNRPKTVSGSLRSALTQIASESGSKLQIKGNQIFILPKVSGKQTGFLLSPRTGMINSPRRMQIDEKDGWAVDMLLNNRISTDSMIRIDSRIVSGNFRVYEGEHSDWITSVEVLPL